MPTVLRLDTYSWATLPLGRVGHSVCLALADVIRNREVTLLFIVGAQGHLRCLTQESGVPWMWRYGLLAPPNPTINDLKVILKPVHLSALAGWDTRLRWMLWQWIASLTMCLCPCYPAGAFSCRLCGGSEFYFLSSGANSEQRAVPPPISGASHNLRQKDEERKKGFMEAPASLM